MTDHLNPNRIYPDFPSRRIDNPPGFDSIRGNRNDWDELSAYRATGLTPEAVQEMVSFPYTADDEEGNEVVANQCVVCGAEMPEGDQVCKACRAGNSKSAITKIKAIAVFLENLGEKQMAAELAGAVRALKGDRA